MNMRKGDIQEKKSLITDASLFLFLQLFDKKKTTSVGRSRRAADSGFVGVCWFGRVSEAGERWTKSHRGSSAFKKTPQSCTGPSWTDTQVKKRHNCSHEEAEDSEFNNASITGQPTCSYDNVREKRPSTSAFFFFFPPSRLLRFDFNAFCVVLYFHAKILLYLNVFILLNVFQIFFFIIPQNCCNYTCRSI